jgi:tRNA(fMet)-specific endonuclease VapC
MERFLLDTNIVSFLVKQPNTAVHHRFRRAQKNYLAISAVTEAELRFGLALLAPQAKLHAAIAEFLSGGINIEPWDSPCAAHYAQLAASQQKQGKPLSPLDTMIAAHALAHDFTLVTNDKAFARIRNLRVEDWTKGPQRA